MAATTEVYVDTSAFIAFLDRSDTYHSLFKRVFSNPPSLITSALVVAETHGWFLRRYDSGRALQFLSFIDELPIKIQPFDHSELNRTAVFVRKFSDQKLTLPDAHGLSIMKQRSIASCWSTDRHLGLTGAALLV